MTNPGQPMPPQPLTPADERLWASLAYFGNILGFIPSLLIFLILGPRSNFVRQESKEALNFAITVGIVSIALIIVHAIVDTLYQQLPSGIDVIFLLLGLLVGLVQFAVWVVNIVLAIIGGLRVNRGGSYRYPFSLRLIK